MLYNCVEFIYTNRYKLNTHFYVKGRISVNLFFGLFAGLFHLVQSIQSQACNSQSTSCKCIKHPFISLLEKKSDSWNNKQQQGFPGGAVVDSLPANAGDAGSSPGLGRSHMPRSN